MTETVRQTIHKSIKNLKTKKYSHKEAGYHEGHGPNGSHCSICEYYIKSDPPDCKKVMQPINPDDGCKYFEPKD